MTIRRFAKGDAQAVSDLIAATLRISNRKDYSEEYIENDIRCLQPEDIEKRAGWQHFYVAEEDGAIVACGAIGPYWDKEDESSLFTIFVHPSLQGRGVGREIMRTLEADEYFLRARRVEIPASVTAAPFYRKMGYAYKDGVTEPDAEGLLRMEKRR